MEGAAAAGDAEGLGGGLGAGFGGGVGLGGGVGVGFGGGVAVGLGGGIGLGGGVAVGFGGGVGLGGGVGFGGGFGSFGADPNGLVSGVEDLSGSGDGADALDIARLAQFVSLLARCLLALCAPPSSVSVTHILTLGRYIS